MIPAPRTVYAYYPLAVHGEMPKQVREQTIECHPPK